MRKTIWRNKKGQIRGIDFALAMVVFMIIFAEVLVLSLSFIEPKYQNVDKRTFQTRAEQISEAFFSSAGYPAGWEYNYSSSFTSFGLKEVSSSALDPNKISRINPKALKRVDYEPVRNSFALEEDLGFQLNIESLFELSISVSIISDSITLDVHTGIGNCPIWTFAIRPEGRLLSASWNPAREITDSNGDYSTTEDISSFPNGNYTMIVFAESRKGHFAVDYECAYYGSGADPINLGLKLLAQEDPANNGRAMLQTTNNGGLGRLRATIVYPFPAGAESLGSETTSIDSPEATETMYLRMPTNGTSVTILAGRRASGAGAYAREFFVFPSILSEETGTAFGGEPITPAGFDIVRIEKIVVIRECIFKVVLYLWPIE